MQTGLRLYAFPLSLQIQKACKHFTVEAFFPTNTPTELFTVET